MVQTDSARKLNLDLFSSIPVVHCLSFDGALHSMRHAKGGIVHKRPLMPFNSTLLAVQMCPLGRIWRLVDDSSARSSGVMIDGDVLGLAGEIFLSGDFLTSAGSGVTVGAASFLVFWADPVHVFFTGGFLGDGESSKTAWAF